MLLSIDSILRLITVVLKNSVIEKIIKLFFKLVMNQSFMKPKHEVAVFAKDALGRKPRRH